MWVKYTGSIVCCCICHWQIWDVNVLRQCQNLSSYYEPGDGSLLGHSPVCCPIDCNCDRKVTVLTNLQRRCGLSAFIYRRGSIIHQGCCLEDNPAVTPQLCPALYSHNKQWTLQSLKSYNVCNEPTGKGPRGAAEPEAQPSVSRTFVQFHDMISDGFLHFFHPNTTAFDYVARCWVWIKKTHNYHGW